MSDVPELVPDAPILHWSFGRSRTTVTWTPVHDQPWSSFVRWLNLDKPASTRESRPYVGATLSRGRRKARSVELRYLLTLDADYADPEFPLDTEIALSGVPYALHTTWRHTPESHRYRLIVPLSRGVTPNEYKELAWRVMNTLGGEQFDKTTVQAERFMWGPSSKNIAEYVFKSANSGGLYLPVDEWLAGTHSHSESSEHTGPVNTPAPIRTSHSEALKASAEEKERAEEILDSAVNDVLNLRDTGEFAGRNEAVFHLLPLLLRFADSGALDENEVLDRLYEAAQSVSSDEPYTRGEFNTSARSARAYADQEGPITPETTATQRALDDFADICTENVVDDFDELWSATPRLTHIAQAADSIGRNRLAMLSAVLVRILVQVEPSVLLVGAQDGSVGSRAALNLGVVLVGQSGQGKSTIQDESRALLPYTKRFEDKPSTGQGLIQAYLEQGSENEEPRLKSEPNKLWLFDEIDTLAATAADRTSTLLSEVRTMLTGGMTGTANATVARRRHLSSRSYNFQMMVNAQPSRTGVLLNDRDGGTPQRFIWTTVTDKHRAIHPKDRPSWPGELDWNDVFTLSFNINESIVDIPQWLKDELLDYDYAVSQEGMEGGDLSKNSHKNLLRLKVATGIAFLHESPRVCDQHVHLADLVLKESYRVQRSCENLMSSSEFNSRLAKARSENKVVDMVDDEKLDRFINNALDKIKKKPGVWVSWMDLRPAYKYRDAWEETVWETLERADNVEVDETEHKYGDTVRKSRKARWAS